MYLRQVNDTIFFGTDERRHKLSTERRGHFKADDVTAAADDLLAAYPEQAERIERYAAKLMTMAK